MCVLPFFDKETDGAKITMPIGIASNQNFGLEVRNGLANNQIPNWVLQFGETSWFGVNEECIKNRIHVNNL